MDTLTGEEKRIIRALERLAARWPPGLWLYSASGMLHLMRDSGKESATGGARREDSIWSTRKIKNDGGDW